MEANLSVIESEADGGLSPELNDLEETLRQKLAHMETAARARDRHEVMRLRAEVDAMNRAILVKQNELFRSTNETSFSADDARAVLGVTSGLMAPAAMLNALPTSERIDRLIEEHYGGRRPHRQGQYAAAAVVAGHTGRAVGLVDAGGKSSHPADERMLLDGHRHGFIAAVTAAFAHHYPLALRPQHFWLLVAQGVATHVDLKAEEVRAQWVAHEGKKTLEVHCDEFGLGKENDWASTVSGKPDSFSAQIAANTMPGVAEALAPAFSGTTEVEDIAQKIVVMDICKNYFSYRCTTECGFPEITLEGTQDDWVLLHEAAGRLLGRCEPSFAAAWAESLLPLLGKLVAARSGEVDAQFWNSMCKRGGTRGSGSRTWFNGWINVFFPYIKRRPNHYCKPYSPSNGYVLEGLREKWYGMREPEGCAGPDCQDFGSGMSSAPVTWEIFSQEIKLDFNAGFTGAVQDPVTWQIRPQISWFITKVVPEAP